MSDRPPLPSRIASRADFDRLLAATTNYEERMPRSDAKRAFDLSRMDALLTAVGDPQREIRTAHVAGSKGKGTVARLIAWGLSAAGRGPVGLYTSPHLEDLAERIAIDGRPVSDRELARAAEVVRPHVAAVRDTPLEPTFFELLTAVAWVAFRAAACSDVVLEVGLGGRLDATNVCAPAVTVITTIELEHTRLLGDTLAKVAAEKAGILKAGVPAITTATGEALEMIRGVAATGGAPLVVIGEDVLVTSVTAAPGPMLSFDLETTMRETVRVPLAGVHHAENVAAAIAALRALGVAEPVEAVRGAALPGLLEAVAEAPLVLVDGAHTPRSAAATRAAVEACWPGRPVVLLTAMLEEKAHAGIGAALGRDVRAAVATQVASPRGLDAGTLAEALAGLDAPIVVEPDQAAALAKARSLAGPDGIVLAAGSVYLAGDVRRRLRGAGRASP